MAKSISQRALEQVQEPEEVEEVRGNKPDYLVKIRQPPQRSADGKLQRSKHFTTVGAAWKQMDKNGKEFIGVKLTVPNLMFADNSFVLYPPYEGEKD